MPKNGIILHTLLFCLSLPLFSVEWRFEPTDSSIHLPEGWELFDNSESGRTSFINPEGTIIFQVSLYPGSTYTSDEEMMDSHLQELDILESDSSRFPFQGGMVSLADCIFLSSGSNIRGWFLFIDGTDYDYYLTGITEESLYADSLPWILSCLDSFSINEEGRAKPGAVSSFLTSDEGTLYKTSLEFCGRQIPFEYLSGREDASQLLIEREATILNSYKDPDNFAAAWKRYYQIISRDTAWELREISDFLEEMLAGKSNREKAEMVLSWLQEFEYGSSDSFSDLLAPVKVLLNRTGDCDALGLVYCSIMNSMGIPSLLMVSYIYSHSMSAVLVDDGGAGFLYNEDRYVVAELTKKVKLGMISQDMADMKNWIVISLIPQQYRSISIIE